MKRLYMMALMSLLVVPQTRTVLMSSLEDGTDIAGLVAGVSLALAPLLHQKIRNTALGVVPSSAFFAEDVVYVPGFALSRQIPVHLKLMLYRLGMAGVYGVCAGSILGLRHMGKELSSLAAFFGLTSGVCLGLGSLQYLWDAFNGIIIGRSTHNSRQQEQIGLASLIHLLACGIASGVGLGAGYVAAITLAQK